MATTPKKTTKQTSASAAASPLTHARIHIRALLAGLDAAFEEREVHARMTLLALVSGHHVLLLGPPGTAKSLLARAVSACFVDATTFEYLLTRFTHPDELFGPVSIPGLKDEDYRRLTEGFLPRAEIAFVDEIFKANSAILNSLLTLVNERVFHHGRHRDRVPLIGLIGASNEAPEPDGGLAALYDRFLVRLGVPAVHDDEAFLRVSLGQVTPFSVDDDARLTLADVAAIRAAGRQISVPAAIRERLLDIRAGLNEAAIGASDRRWRWAVELMCVAAATSGRRTLGAVDLLLLEHCFGEPGDTAPTVRQIVRRALEVLVAPDAGVGVGEAWEALSRPSAAAGTPGFQGALHARLTQLSAFEATLLAAEQALDVRREAVVGEAGGSPWIPEVPARLVAGFIAARRRLAAYRTAVERYRQQLDALDLYGTVLPRARAAQLSSVGHSDLMLYDGREPPLWISPAGAPPDAWVPVSAEGLLQLEQRTVIAGAVQRDLNDGVMGDDVPVSERRWHDHVNHVSLDNGSLFGLLQGGPEACDELHADPGARRALRALAEWLRGVGVRDLPGPPTVDP